MISIVRANERFLLEGGWLQARWHFSFGDYYDPSNMGWGALRVFNDDHIAPGGKFDLHPHANYEILTVVLSGAITHMDSAGHQGVVKADGVQAMTAGRGVHHSEENVGKLPLHSLQIWLTPDQKGLEPSWKSHSFSKSDFKNKLCPLASGVKGVKAPLSIHQDATIFRSQLAKEQKLAYSLSTSRLSYLFVISGELLLNLHEMKEGDSAKIKSESSLSISASSACDFLLFDLPPA